MFSVLNDVKRKLAVFTWGKFHLIFFSSFSNIPDSIFESGLIWGHARSFRIPKIQGGDIARAYLILLVKKKGLVAS